MRNKLIIFFATLFYTTSLFAQYEVTIEAFVLNKETNRPIPYVNIGFIKKSIGTVSKEDGKFTLIYHEDIIGGKELLQFSALGYRTLKVRASQLVKFLTNTNKFYLEQEPFALNEVLLTNEKRSRERLGTMQATRNTFGYWKGEIALGGEITTKIKINKKSTKLLDLEFNLVENTADSLRVRVNVYDYKNRFPTSKLISNNIVHTITSGLSHETISLEPYNIIVSDDIVVGIELVEVFGDKIRFAISANNKTGTSFTKRISQDKWNRHLGIGMNFTVLTSYPVKPSQEVSILRKNPRRITVYWDTSLMMKERHLGDELDFLSNYFKIIKSSHVEVIKFSTTVKESKMFILHNGKNKEVFDYLKNSTYDGAANYSKILKTNDFNAEAILLFTDGNSFFYSIDPKINTPIFCINSKYKAKHLQLQKAAFYADGYYINLYKTSSKNALKFILNEEDDKRDYTDNTLNELSLNQVVKGKVFSASEPLQGATIQIKNSFVEVQSARDGFFEINAEDDDVLLVNYIGMIQKELMVSHFQNGKIELEPDGILLDAIIIEAKKRKQKKIETAYGIKDYDAIGFGASYITAEDIKPSDVFLSQVLRRVSGINVTGFGDNVKVTIRSNGIGEKSALFDVDGMVTSTLPFINIQRIVSISVLKSYASTNRYGAEGAGGVIVIKTISSLRDENGEPINIALVKDNDYEEDLPAISNNQKESWYMEQFHKANSYEAALAVYRDHENAKIQLSVPYYLDVSEYFKKWDEDRALTILSNIAEIAYSNPKALKVLAYKLEASTKYKDAQQVYEQILILRPNASQSYRDLAAIYVENGNYSKALDLYKHMINNTISGVDFSGLNESINNELKHLVLVHRSKIDFSGLEANFLSAKFKVDLRIVFEWNDTSTEFELQFVNPKKKFFKWMHSTLGNKELLINEAKNGYNTKEFIIDDADAGEWIINIECLSDEDLLNPTYLKYTVYKNYGLANETKKIKVIKLYDQKQKVTLDAFFYK